jgi:MazG family protein
MPGMSDAFDRLVAIMDRLRDPGGCPWDREQTMQSLSGYLLEEAYEVTDAVASEDGNTLREELGDLLLQIVFLARIGREKGWFDIDQVCESISDKMVRRHPHVFGDREVSDASEVIRNWEDIKKEEHGSEVARSTLDGVPAALPGLLKAFRMTEKAAAVGFDWRKPRDVMVKLHEEVGELEAELDGLSNGDLDRVRDEMGDVLFVMANLARHLGVEPETALQGTNTKFMRRFRAMEEEARNWGRDFREMSLDEQDDLWECVKAQEDDA